jgi:hypothetical protein
MFTSVFETGSRVTGSPIGTESGFLAGGPQGSEGAVSETPDRISTIKPTTNIKQEANYTQKT